MKPRLPLGEAPPRPNQATLRRGEARTRGWLFATPEEAAPFLARLGARKTASQPFETYSLKPAGVAIISGMGPQAAAAATEHLICSLGVSEVVNAGVCGALADGLVPEQVFRISEVADGDAVLASRAAQALPVSSADWPHLRAARLASSAQPVFEADRRARLAAHAELADMEGFAVATACRRHGIPCGLIKGVTDQADGAGKEDIRRNLARVSARLADEMIGRPESVRHPGGTVSNILRFTKVEHTIFSLPLLLAGAWLGAGGRMPPWRVLLLIVLAGIGARGLGMAMNRILDRRLDALNPRTANRELPSGRMSPVAAWSVAATALVVYLLACAALGRVCLLFSPVPAAVLIGYSLLKRFTSLCHFGIGLCLGLAPLGAYIASSGSPVLTGPVLLLSLFAFSWMSGFDIIYSLQDVDSDRRTGVHSLPARLGPRGALVVAGISHAVSAGAVGLLWWTNGRGVWSGAALVVALGAFVGAYVPRLPLPVRFFTMSAVAGIAGASVPLLGGL